jgi:beta-N-acetylhexosaminidase
MPDSTTLAPSRAAESAISTRFVRVRVAVVIAVGMLLLAGCGRDEEESSSAPASTAPALTVPEREATDADTTARTEPSRPRPAPASSTADLPRRVGRLIVFAFAGTSLPDYVRDILRERRAAGVILFGANVASPGQVRRLTRSVQDAAGGRALVMADQEGGPIRIIRFAPPARGQPRQATPAAARASAIAAARGLRGVGVNVNLAPVLDVPDGSVFRSRTYPGDAAQIGASGRAAIQAYSRGGVAATAKHFPGLGSATANTDDAPATVVRGRTQLLRRDLGPFRAAIGAGVPLVMASHALFPGLDRERIASQSPAVLTDLLRRDLRFRGVTVTDSLEADAVQARSSSVAAAAVRSIRAGADIALLTGPGSYPSVYRRLLRDAREDPRFRARVDEAGKRVEHLQRNLAG